jgi:hypothetical protein
MEGRPTEPPDRTNAENPLPESELAALERQERAKIINDAAARWQRVLDRLKRLKGS